MLLRIRGTGGPSFEDEAKSNKTWKQNGKEKEPKVRRRLDKKQRKRRNESGGFFVYRYFEKKGGHSLRIFALMTRRQQSANVIIAYGVSELLGCSL
ncbi:hypothetical protein KM043_014484 [Ampulex compressa]|nr:hypothetical protein KM043_014484 [Ampulex compressa]